MFEKRTKRVGFVLFSKLSDAEQVYNFFNFSLKKNPSKNSNGDLLEVQWGYDLLDLKDSGWFGVVLRNVPPKCTEENVKNQCSKQGEVVLYALTPTQIKNQFCSIVVMETLEDAEKLCLNLNHK